MLANIPRNTKRFLTTLTRGVKTCKLLEKISQKNFLQPQECGVTSVTVTDEPVPRPSTTFFVFSWAKHFFFPISSKYQRVPIWLKFLNLKQMLQNIGNEKASTCTHLQNGNESNARNRNLFRIK